MSDTIHTIADLQRYMGEALRQQHPEWVQPDGESPILKDYQARFARLLSLTAAPAGTERELAA